jgi:hypothetical protein
VRQAEEDCVQLAEAELVCERFGKGGVWGVVGGGAGMNLDSTYSLNWTNLQEGS